MVCRPAAAAHREDLPLKDTVIVFARVPRLGAVKRRLARGIGPRAALPFYRTTLGSPLRALVRARRFRTVLAATSGHGRTRWPRERVDVGAHMHRVSTRFPRGRVAIVDSDVLHVSAGAGDGTVAEFRAWQP